MDENPNPIGMFQCKHTVTHLILDFVQYCNSNNYSINLHLQNLRSQKSAKNLNFGELIVPSIELFYGTASLRALFSQRILGRENCVANSFSFEL